MLWHTMEYRKVYTYVLTVSANIESETNETDTRWQQGIKSTGTHSTLHAPLPPPFETSDRSRSWLGLCSTKQWCCPYIDSDKEHFGRGVLLLRRSGISSAVLSLTVPCGQDLTCSFEAMVVPVVCRDWLGSGWVLGGRGL